MQFGGPCPPFWRITRSNALSVTLRLADGSEAVAWRKECDQVSPWRLDDVPGAEPTPPTFNVNGAGFKGANVQAVEAGLVGFYHGGKPWTPDRTAIRALLPHRWRAAFDRAGGFWSDAHHNATPAYVHVTDRRGRHLTTVYAHPVPPAA